MRWTKEQFDAYENRRLSSRSIPKPAICDEPLAAQAGKDFNPKRIRLCVTGFRRRLLDPDNFCPKYFIDCLRFAGIIQDDSPEFIILETNQVKVKFKQQERTEITIEDINQGTK